MHRTDARAPALAADVLTGSRFLASIAMVLLMGDDALTGVAVLLALAWLSDFLDGRLARLTSATTRLGHWDVWADIAVGVGLLIGLMLNDHIPLWGGLTALLLFGGLALAGNIAAMMLLQLSGFLPTLWLLRDGRVAGWWLPPAAALAIGVFDWRRLVYVNIRNFVRGVSGRFEHPWQ